MVCIPCIIAPIALWIWFHFLHPIVSKFLNLRKPAPIAATNSDGTSNSKGLSENIEGDNSKLNPGLQSTYETVENKEEKVSCAEAVAANETGDKKNV